MKKLLAFALVATLGTASMRAADSGPPNSEQVVRVETCEAILRDFMANPAAAIPPGCCASCTACCRTTSPNPSYSSCQTKEAPCV